ncbi:unnamed protein product, partial [Mesorhabditis spiculigera]
MSAPRKPGVRHPKYAIISLGTEPDIQTLFGKLQELGYYEISFVHSLTDSPYYIQEEAAARKRRKVIETEVKRDALSPHNSCTPASTSFETDLDGAVPTTFDTTTEEKPLARIEIVEKALNLGNLGALAGDEDEGESIPEPEFDEEPQISDALIQQLFDKPESSHGFSRDRDYKYKLESGVQDCQECGRQFFQSQFKNILAHAKSHYQVKPWGCPCCSAQAGDSREMRLHIRQHHPEVKNPMPVSNGIATTRLRGAWAQVARRCFPKLAARIDKWELNVCRLKPKVKEDPVSIHTFF